MNINNLIEIINKNYHLITVNNDIIKISKYKTILLTLESLLETKYSDLINDFIHGEYEIQLNNYNNYDIKKLYIIDNLHDIQRLNIKFNSESIYDICLNKFNNNIVNTKIIDLLNKNKNINNEKYIHKYFSLFTNKINEFNNSIINSDNKKYFNKLKLNSNIYYETTGIFINDSSICPFKKSLDKARNSCDSLSIRNEYLGNLYNFDNYNTSNIIIDTITNIPKIIFDFKSNIYESFLNDLNVENEYKISYNNINKVLNSSINGVIINTINNSSNNKLNNDYLDAGLHLKRLGDYFQVDFFIKNNFDIFQTRDNYCWLYSIIKINKENKFKISILRDTILGININNNLLTIQANNDIFINYINENMNKIFNKYNKIGGRINNKIQNDLIIEKSKEKQINNILYDFMKKNINRNKKIEHNILNNNSNSFINKMFSDIESIIFRSNKNDFIKKYGEEKYNFLEKILNIMEFLEEPNIMELDNPKNHIIIFNYFNFLKEYNNIIKFDNTIIYFIDTILKLYNKIYKSNKSNLIFYFGGDNFNWIIKYFWIFSDYFHENLNKIPIEKLLIRDCHMIISLYLRSNDTYGIFDSPTDPNDSLTNFDYIEGDPDFFNNKDLYQKYDHSNKNRNKYKSYDPKEFFHDVYLDPDNFLDNNVPRYILPKEYIEKYKLHKMYDYFDEINKPENKGYPDKIKEIKKKYFLNFIPNSTQNNNTISISELLHDFLNNL